MYKLVALIVIALVAVPTPPIPGQGQIGPIGTRLGATVVRFALPEFQPKSADPNLQRLTALFNQVLWDDLDYSGSIALVSRSFYPVGRFQGPSDIRVDDWTKTGVNAQYISFGNTEIVGRSLVVVAHMWDLAVVEDREQGKRLTSGDLTDDAIRLTAHMFADVVVDKLFGGRMGIARTKIAYVSATSNTTKEIYLMDYDGANATALTSYRSTSIMPNWAPDGERLAFLTTRRNTWQIEIMSWLDRRSHPFEPVGGTLNLPAWSPDASQIAFSSSKDGNTELYVADWNGRNQKRLTVQKGNDLSPSWSKTGRQIAFVSDRSGSQQLYIMDSDGTNVQRIINEGGDAENPSWSPDGQFIAFAWQKSGTGRYDIYIHDLGTGRNTQLTQNAGDNERPSWAPDGRHLVFASTRAGSSQIYSMLANGEKLRQLTKTGRNEGPAWSSFVGK